MPIKYKIKSKEEVPVEHAGLYVERDGAFYLDVEGAVDRARVDEFRNTNVSLMRQVQELQARIESGTGRPRTDGEMGEQVQALRGELNALKAERDGLNGRLTAIQVDQGVITAATKRGLRATAIADITARARSVFKLVNGAPRAFEADGQTVRYGRDGVTPMSLEEWTDLQVQEAPHLFESNAGGGAPGHQAGGGPSGLLLKNPAERKRGI